MMWDGWYTEVTSLENKIFYFGSPPAGPPVPSQAFSKYCYSKELNYHLPGTRKG